MEYLTVNQVAELKGISVRAVQKSISDGKLSCSIEFNGKNRPKYMIPIPSLPEDLQTKYYALKRAEAGLEPDPIKKAVKQSNCHVGGYTKRLAALPGSIPRKENRSG